MKRITILVLLVGAIAAVLAAPLASGSPGAKKPTCTDIIGGGFGGSDGFYANGDGTATFNFSMDLAATACKNVTYTFYVSYNGGPFTAFTGTASGTRVTMPAQTYTLDPTLGDNNNVCVYATSSRSGDNDVYDRAPDRDCLTVTLGSSPGNSSFS